VRALAVALALLVGVAACSGDDDQAARATTTSASTTSTTALPTTTTGPATTTSGPVSPAWPRLPTGPAKAVVTPNGIVLAVRSVNTDGTYVATSPCGNAVTVHGTPLAGAHIVLDPGHGGGETGAVGPGGTQEKTVNLAVAKDLQRRLQGLGATVVLTRTEDYRITLASRAAVAQALHPLVFLSIHHNAEPDGPRDGPGSETYFQIGQPDSHRLAGLVYEEMVKALSQYHVAWTADRDAGAKYRPASDGGDYYGILRRTAGIPAVLSEAAFLTNPPEEALLRDPKVQDVEAGAFERAIVRYLTTQDPGSGFVEPYPRTEPAGNGGGATGCVDPSFG